MYLSLLRELLKIVTEIVSVFKAYFHKYTAGHVENALKSKSEVTDSLNHYITRNWWQ